MIGDKLWKKQGEGKINRLRSVLLSNLSKCHESAFNVVATERLTLKFTCFLSAVNTRPSGILCSNTTFHACTTFGSLYRFFAERYCCCVISTTKRGNVSKSARKTLQPDSIFFSGVLAIVRLESAASPRIQKWHVFGDRAVMYEDAPL